MGKANLPAEKENELEPEVRYSTTDIEQLREQVAALQAQQDEIQTAILKLTKVIMGNGGPGLKDALLDLQGVHSLLDKFSIVIQGLGGLFETLHHQGQEKDKELSGTRDFSAVISAWKEVAQMWQMLFLAQRQVTEQL